MNHISDTLTKAYQMIEAAGKPYSTEISTILTMFISPSRITSFNNDNLYLSLLENIINERENISFPDKASDFHQFFQDCILLKEQMEGKGLSKDHYLAFTARLLENLKTPYYHTFSFVLLSLEKNFVDYAILNNTLQKFYSMLLKSTEESQKLIRIIAGQASVYRQYFFIDDIFLSDLLTHHLSVFACEKDLWTESLRSLLYGKTEQISRDKTSMLADYFSQEETFLKYFKPEADHSCVTLPEFLSGFHMWLSSCPDIAPLQPAQNLSMYSDSGLLQLDSKFLNTYAYNMTARSYRTNPAIGRESEIHDLELILISPKKSPVFIGESGVGKTSVVEGLSYLLQRGQVPALLKNKKIFKLTTTSLLSGTKYVGEMEERIKELMRELEKYPDVILFIDEIHTIVGAGSTESSNNDISNMLKPFIDRGDIKIIGATTSQEYADYILPDKALARRFYPITVEEPDENMTFEILSGTIPSIEQETKVQNIFSNAMTESILRRLIFLSQPEFQPNGQITRRPELPLTLLEMAFSYAALESRQNLTLSDVLLSVRHTNLLRKEVREKAADYFSDIPKK